MIFHAQPARPCIFKIHLRQGVTHLRDAICSTADDFLYNAQRLDPRGLKLTVHILQSKDERQNSNSCQKAHFFKLLLCHLFTLVMLIPSFKLEALDTRGICKSIAYQFITKNNTNILPCCCIERNLYRILL